MNFDFSDELKQLRDQARRFLSEQSPPKVVRQVLDGDEPYAAGAVAGDGGDGMAGAAIPEQYGGAGLGYEGLCVLAEELGRALAPVPFASSAYLATEACCRPAATRRSGDCAETGGRLGDRLLRFGGGHGAIRTPPMCGCACVGGG